MDDRAKTKQNTCRPFSRSLRPSPAWLAIVFFFVLFIPASGFPANFSISPTSLELGGGVKSGVFSVINGGDEKLNCQIDVKEWSQDADGKDVYTETKDIVFFPKIMTVGRGEQRAVRIGIKVPAGMKEKTYRLFVEEVPSQKKGPDAAVPGKITAGLTIAFRYAAPIFVEPARPQGRGSIENMEMAKGTAGATVRNTGNVRMKLLTVTFRGKARDGRELFSKDVGGWYVLRGGQRRYETAVPKELCKTLSTIEVSAQAEHVTINGAMDVKPAMCAE
jgi:fimbrial chaperone protein